jgi:hypothetical protein
LATGCLIATASHLDIERDVQIRRRLGDPARRRIVDAGLCDRRDGVEGDAAGGLQRQPAGHQRDRRVDLDLRGTAYGSLLFALTTSRGRSCADPLASRGLRHPFLLLLARIARLRCDEVGDLRLAFLMELMHRVLHEAVGIGHTLVLAQMLEP